MQTKKMSVGELKVLKGFTAVSSTGKQATFEVEGDFATDINTGKKVRLDSIRRSWEVVIENTKSEEEVNMEENNTCGVPANEEVSEEVVEVTEEEVVEVGSVVELEDGREGVVTDIYNEILTVEIGDAEEEVGVNIADVTLLDKEAPAKPEVQEEPEVEEVKEPKAPKATVKRTSTSVYEELIKTELPSVKKVSDTSIKQIFELEDVTLEYITGTIEWKSAEENGCDMVTEWELLRSKKTGSWHGVFFKENGVVIKEAIVDGKEVKDLSKSKSAVKKFLFEGYGVNVQL